MKFVRSLSVAVALGVLALVATAGMAQQQSPIMFNTELVELNLSGGPFPIPLASDPNNALGDSVDGYGFVNSNVVITLSSQRSTNPGQRSLGETWAYLGGGQVQGTVVIDGGDPALPLIDPPQLNGQEFFVDSFFDVFFDITVTDADPRPGRNYAGTPPASEVGATLTLPDNRPVTMESSYTAIFNMNAHNFGLFPPSEDEPFVSPAFPTPVFTVALGMDINGNGHDDKIAISFTEMAVADASRRYTTLPDGTTVRNDFNANMYLISDVMDVISDPPFTIGAQIGTGGPAFGGPTTATSTLMNPVTPEPATLALLAVGGTVLGWRRRRRR